MVNSVAPSYDRNWYIPRSIALIVGAYGGAALLFAFGLSKNLSMAPGLILLILLAVATYRRLKDANLSAGWLGFMFLNFGFGPSWGGLEPFDLRLSVLIMLIPIFLGWMVPSKGGATNRSKAVAKVSQ